MIVIGKFTEDIKGFNSPNAHTTFYGNIELPRHLSLNQSVGRMSGQTDQPTNPLRGSTIRGEWETLGVMKGQYVTQRPSVFLPA